VAASVIFRTQRNARIFIRFECDEACVPIQDEPVAGDIGAGTNVYGDELGCSKNFFDRCIESVHLVNRMSGGQQRRCLRHAASDCRRIRRSPSELENRAMNPRRHQRDKNDLGEQSAGNGCVNPHESGYRAYSSHERDYDEQW